MKLQLKHLAPYLPYQLRYRLYGNFPVKEGEYNIIEYYAEVSSESINKVIEWDSCKPILRPLSDLTKEIEHNGEKFMPIDLLNKIHPLFAMEEGKKVELDDIGISYTETTISDYLYLVNQLFEWHFDVFGLIERGLAVDKNKLDK